MGYEFQRLPFNIIPKVEEMWDIQERDGYCKVAKDQTSNPWKDDEDGDGGGDDDDDIQVRGGGKPSKMA